MRAMTVDTNCAGQQTLFGQTTAVNAGRVIGRRVHFGKIGDRRRLSLCAVTLAAKRRNRGSKRGCVVVTVRLCIVAAVAGRAVGGLRYPRHVGLAVPTGEILIGNLGVTTRAIDESRGFARSVQSYVDIGVTFDARDVFVDRLANLGPVDVERQCIAPHDFVYVGLLVAFEAVSVRDG